MKRPLFTALSAVLAGLLFQSCRPAAPEAREAAAELPPEVVQPAAEAPAARPLWPHYESDLEPDPAVQWGVLPNGLRILSVPQEWQTVVTGAILIVAVYMDVIRRRA